MNSDLLVALLSGTGLASLLTVGYRIWKERRHNTQQDLAGDLTLGELFRDVARKEVLAVQHDMETLQKTVRELRACKDRLEMSVRELTQKLDEQGTHIDLLERKYRGAQDYVRVLVSAWQEMMPGHPLPEPPEEYFPDSRTIKRGKQPPLPPQPLT